MCFSFSSVVTPGNSLSLLLLPCLSHVLPLHLESAYVHAHGNTERPGIHRLKIDRQTAYSPVKLDRVEESRY